MTDQIVIYQSPDGTTLIDVRLEAETVWLTQKQMAELFDKDVGTVNEHIRNIFKEGELVENSVIRKFRITATAKTIRSSTGTSGSEASCFFFTIGRKGFRGSSARTR